MSETIDYNRISAEFGRLSEVDPNKRDAQYYTAKQLLGDLAGKTVLEIGCGSGVLARDLAKSGAKVFAFDSSIEQIKRAKAKEDVDPVGVKYFQADAANMALNRKVDFVVGVLVLQHAKDRAELGKFFATAAANLKPEGKLIALVTNPDFQRFDQRLYNRTYTRTGDGRIKVTFENPQTGEQFEVFDTDFKKHDYEASAADAGLSLRWEPMKIDPKSKQDQGEFWSGFEEDPPYLSFVAERKNND